MEERKLREEGEVGYRYGFWRQRNSQQVSIYVSIIKIGCFCNFELLDLLVMQRKCCALRNVALIVLSERAFGDYYWLTRL